MAPSRVIGLGRSPRNEHRKRDREEHLDLQHQRGEAGGHADVKRGVEEGELAEADEHAVTNQDRQRNARARHEQQHGQDDDVARRRQDQRRQLEHAPLHEYEVEAPHHHDGKGEQLVAGCHGVSLGGATDHLSPGGKR